MADSDNGLGTLFLVVIGVFLFGLAIVVVWVILATALRILAYVITVYYPIVAALALLAGVICAVVVVIRSIRGATARPARTLTPADVADRGFFRKPPKGEARHFGWDRAWPRYLPFQARRDIEDAVRAAFGFLSMFTRRILAVPSGLDDGAPVVIAIGLMLLLGLVPYVVFVASFAAATAVLIAVVTLVVVGAWCCQVVAIHLLRGFDYAVRRVFGLSTRCGNGDCYRESPLPSYECSRCTVVHRDLRPGRLGVLWHRCECSAVLPTMVIRASGWGLRKNVRCPICDRNLPEGTGSRKTIQVPTFGALGVGKTRLLLAAIIGLYGRLADTRTRISPLEPQSSMRIERARALIASGSPTTKTPADENPEALRILVEPENGRPIELHFLDAAGERFTAVDGAADLHYLESAETLLFVIDPFSTAEMRAAVPDPAAVGLIVGDEGPEDSYSATIELLRTNGLRPAKRSLGIVVTKADDLRRLGFADGLDATDENSIRTWLVAKGADNVTIRARQDFKRVRYFLTDSMGQMPRDPHHPVHVLDWLTGQVGARLLPPTIP